MKQFKIAILALLFIVNINNSYASTVVFVAGGTGSGKTCVADKLKESLGNRVAIISQDSYYKDLSHLPKSEREKTNFDHPDSIEFDLLKKHLIKLKEGKSIEVPTYDFSNHNRTDKSTLVNPQEVIIVEGILLLAMQEIRELADIKIFVDVDHDERLLRRIKRDIEERGRTITSIQKQYLDTVKPMHEIYVEPSKQFADLIIPKGGHNKIAINLLVSQLNDLLSAPINKKYALKTKTNKI